MRIRAADTADDDLRPSSAEREQTHTITFSTLRRPTTPSVAPGVTGPDLVLRHADDDLWVATSDGEYAGLVTRRPDGFHVHDRYTRPLAVVATLEQASARLAATGTTLTAAAHRARPTTVSAALRRWTTVPASAGRTYRREKSSWLQAL